MSDDEVSAMQTENGVAGFAAIVTDLLTATFGPTSTGGEPPNP